MPDKVGQDRPHSEREWGALIFVSAIWALLSVATLLIGEKNASPIPWIDDWDLVKPLTGAEPIRTWLWSPYINHSVPLPRVFLLGIYKLNGSDFRAAPIVNVTVLSVLSLGMILAARRVRGKIAYTDAIFPLALLNVDREILFATLGVNLIPSTVCSCLVLVLMLRLQTHQRRRTIIYVAILMLALAMCGSSGAAQVPPLAIWLIYVGIIHWRGKSQDLITAWLAWGLAAVVMIYLVWAFPNPERDPSLPAHPGSKAALRTSLEFLSTTFGPAAWTIFSATPASKPWLGMIVAILGVATAGLLIWAWLRHPAERTRAAGLLLLLCGMGIFALGVGWGRAEAQPGAGCASRYSVYTSPILFMIYFAWQLYGPSFSSRLIPFTLFAALIALFVPNVSQSLDQVKAHRHESAAVERDLLAGTPPALIAERHAEFLLTSLEFKDHLTQCMRLLHDKGIGIFRQLQDPETAEISLPLRPDRVHQLVWNDGLAECQGDDPFLVFNLKEPTFVYGIRVRLKYEQTVPPLQIQMYWKVGDQDFSEQERNWSKVFFTPAAETTVLAIVNANIDSFRLDVADKSCRVRVESIVLIVPKTAVSR